MNAPEHPATSTKESAQTQKRLRTLLLLLLLSPMLFAMQCSNEDLTQEFRMDLQSNAQPERITIALPYTGRIALDLSIDADSAGEVTLRTQVKTSGNPDEEGCDAIAAGRTRQVDAAPWDGNSPPVDDQIAYPTIGNLSVRTQFLLPRNDDLDAFAGAIELATDHELIRVYSTDNDLSLWDLNGNIVPPIADTHSATCDDVFVTVYEMPRNNVRIAYHSDNATLEQVVIADCAEDRVVDRVCPGMAGDIQEDTFTLTPATQHVQRFSALGVGDTLVVEATCDGACPATLRLFGWIEPLQCRTRNDCSGARTCTHDGYCIKEPPPTCTSITRVHPLTWLLALFGLLWIAFGARRTHE